MTRGVYPGSFNPPTIGHLAIIRAAIQQHSLRGLDLVISRRPLGKGVVERPTLEQRARIIEASVADIDEASVLVTDLQLVADIADGYDVVVMGADKWAQVNDPAFYEDDAHLRASLDRLPDLAIVGRGAHPVPAHARLVVPTSIETVSSTGARAGRPEWMTVPARSSGFWT